MTVRIVCVGKLKERYFEDACAEFQKRLGRFCTLETVEVADEKAPESLHPADEVLVREKEGKRILKAIGAKDFVVALAIDGRQMTSEAFAAFLEEKEAEARIPPSSRTRCTLRSARGRRPVPSMPDRC